MTSESLKKANKLQAEIRELEVFISNAESVWTGKIIKRDTKYIFKTNGYGAIDGAEYNLSYEMKNRVLDLLKAHLKELKDELKSI